MGRCRFAGTQTTQTVLLITRHRAPISDGTHTAASVEVRAVLEVRPTASPAR